jgi:Flp pilus assembly protein TadG
MPRSLILKLFGDRRGVAAIEFAFALPILCMMVFALYEVAEGVITYYRVVDVANSVADLVGQTTQAEGGIGNTDFDNLYLAGQEIMSPASGTTLELDIASLTFNAKGTTATLAWQVERGGATKIATATLKSDALPLAIDSGSVIAVKATYTYTSALNYFITTPITMTFMSYALPRNMTSIPCPPPSGGETCN